MNIKNILTILAAVLFIIPAKAQNIGYQGKKSTFYYNAYFMPRSLVSKSETTDGTSLNIGHAFEFDYAYSQSNSIGLSYRAVNSRQVGIGNMITQNNGTVTFADAVQPTFTPTMIGLFIKFRTFEKIAPLGTHTKLSLYMNQTTVDYNPDEVMDPANYTTTGTKPLFVEDPWGGNNGMSYTNFAIGYSIGNQRIIANRFLFTYGVEYVYPLTENFKEQNNHYSTNDVGDHLREMAFVEANSSAKLNIHIGFGILGPRKRSLY